MSIAVAFTALIESLKREVTWFNDNELVLKLFVNNIDPTSDTEVDDFTEPTATWYDPVDCALWDPDAITYDSPYAKATHPDITYTPNSTTSETVYGYFLVDMIGALIWSERFSGAPFTVGPAPAQALTITPVYWRRSEFHSS